MVLILKSRHPAKVDNKQSFGISFIFIPSVFFPSATAPTTAATSVASVIFLLQGAQTQTI